MYFEIKHSMLFLFLDLIIYNLILVLILLGFYPPNNVRYLSSLSKFSKQTFSILDYYLDLFIFHPFPNIIYLPVSF